MWSCFRNGACILLAILGPMSSSVFATTIFFGPTPYLSAADIPPGFYAGGPSALENFEDGVLNFGITATAGSFAYGPNSTTDSVDADDGVIDGSGNAGRTWVGPYDGLTFTFTGPLPTAAGLVWTDGGGLVVFEAFGPGMVSLGTRSFITPSGVYTGETAEDRFLGVQNTDGILALKIRDGDCCQIEADHVQFGIARTASPVPEPAPLPFVVVAAIVMSAVAARRASSS